MLTGRDEVSNDNHEVEDETHFLINYELHPDLRIRLESLFTVSTFKSMSPTNQAVFIMQCDALVPSLAAAVSSMYKRTKSFCEYVPRPTLEFVPRRPNYI